MNFPKAEQIDKNIKLYFIQTSKFKTFSIHVFFHRPLNDEATKNALIPLVLRRGCKGFETMQDISKYLEELYGASFDCGVSKKGERHILRFNIEAIYNKTVKEEGIFEKCLEFLYKIIFVPVIENGYFRRDYTMQEKETLKKIIEGKLNDKSKYALDRCIEEMCKDEPYKIYEYGDVDDLERINEIELYTHYKHLLETSPIDIFVVGNLEQEFVAEKIKSVFKIKQVDMVDIKEVKATKKIKDVNYVDEIKDVAQGKLCMGFRTNIHYEDDNYFPLIVYNSILGGGTTSKLFIYVREKASLAYSTSSRIDKFKGLMFITAGIDSANYQKAVDIILNQLEEMKNGNISENEINSAVSSLTTSIRSLSDSHLYIVDYFFSQAITNSYMSFEKVIEKIKSVKKDDLINIPEKLQLDTVYFLKGK